MERGSTRAILIFIFIIINSGCAYLGYLKDPLESIPNFHKVDERLFRGGRPDKKGWEKLKKLGVQSVICLKGEGKEMLEDKRLADSWGFKFYHLPLSVYRQPQEEEVIKFLEIVLNKENQPVFVYCDSGRDRTGAMVALYRVVVKGWQPKQAYQEAKRLGFWPYYGEAELKKFILQLKDKKIYFTRAEWLLQKEK